MHMHMYMYMHMYGGGHFSQAHHLGDHALVEPFPVLSLYFPCTFTGAPSGRPRAG